MEAAEAAPAAFAASPWGEKYQAIAPAWQRAWAHVIPFYDFPTDDAALKLLWLALRNALAARVRSAKEWNEAMNQFAILYGDRFIRVAV